MMITKETVLNILKDFKICDNAKICVALSGGADSVCLLHNLYSLAEELNIHLSAVHVNHNLRGMESERDSLFCSELCKKLGIKLYTFSVNVISNKNNDESIELTARKLRYEAFEKIDADYIATAHTAEDSLETFLINFIRGTGLKGLCGIPKIREKFIRPLYKFSREDVENYCKTNSLTYVTDSSNLTDDYTRNKLRHNVIPVLKNINPSVISVAQRNMELISSDNDFIEQSVNNIYDKAFDKQKGLATEHIYDLHFSLSSRVLINFFKINYDINLDQNHLIQVLNLCKIGKGRTQLTKGYFAEVKRGWLNLLVVKSTNFSASTSVVSKEKFENMLKINNSLLINAIDYDKIIGKLGLRTRIPGDVLRPVGRGLSKPVRRLQAEKNVPENVRSKLPIAYDEQGVVWCYLVGADERVKPDKNTQNFLIFDVKENLNNNLGEGNYDT